jgi:hypothetical protein
VLELSRDLAEGRPGAATQKIGAARDLAADQGKT